LGRRRGGKGGNAECPRARPCKSHYSLFALLLGKKGKREKSFRRPTRAGREPPFRAISEKEGGGRKKEEGLGPGSVSSNLICSVLIRSSALQERGEGGRRKRKKKELATGHRPVSVSFGSFMGGGGRRKRKKWSFSSFYPLQHLSICMGERKGRGKRKEERKRRR